MASAPASGNVTYSRKGEEYFEQRELKRVAGPWKLGRHRLVLSPEEQFALAAKAPVGPGAADDAAVPA